MDQEIKKVITGETPSLLDADKANELIDAINALRKMEVSPQGLGEFTQGEKNVVLNLNPLKALFNQLSTVVAAMSTTTPGGGGGGGGGSSSDWKTAYNALLTALASSTISAACDPTTRAITVTWNISLPPAQ